MKSEIKRIIRRTRISFALHAALCGGATAVSLWHLPADAYVSTLLFNPYTIDGLRKMPQGLKSLFKRASADVTEAPSEATLAPHHFRRERARLAAKASDYAAELGLQRVPEIKIIEHKDPLAGVSNSGKIILTSAIVDCLTENGRNFVLGHEMGHLAIAKHPILERKAFAYLGWLSLVAGVFAASYASLGGDNLAYAAHTAVGLFGFLSYKSKERMDEYASDAVAVVLTGDANAPKSFFKRYLAAAGEEHRRIAKRMYKYFWPFLEHPSPAKRITHMQRVGARLKTPAA